MTRDVLIDGLSVPGVLPILPAAAGVLAVLLTAIFSIILATVTLRPGAWVLLLKAIWRQKWGLLVLVLLGAGVVRVAALVSDRQPIDTEQTEPISGQWPMFRGSLQRTGHADDLPGPSTGGVEWIGGRGLDFLASPAVAGQRVLAVGYQGDTARIFAWDADTGEQVWTAAPQKYRASFASPVIDDALLVCGEGLHSTTDARVLCLDPERADHARPLMQFTTSGHIECTPSVSDGRIYANAGDDGIYCLTVDAEQTALDVVWHAPGEQYPDAETSLAIHGTHVYVGLGHGGEALCKLDADTGREVLRREMPWPVFSPPAILDGRLYVGMGRANYVDTSDFSEGQVQCLDLDSLEEIWMFPTPAAVLSAIVVDAGEVIFSTVDGDVFILNQQGRELRRWRTSAPMLAAPAVTDQMVFCIANDGVLTGLNRSRLRPVWRVRLGEPGRYASSPIVFRGRIYVGTPDGLVCAGKTSTARTDELWPSRLGGPGNSGAYPDSQIPARVAVAWTLNGPAPGNDADVSAPPAVAAGDLIVPMASDEWAGLVCTDWRHSDAPLVRWTFTSSAPIRVSPVITGNVVVCLCGESGQAGDLVAIERGTGAELWREFVVRVSDTLSTDGHSIMLGDGAGHLMRYNMEGERQWRREIGRLDHPVDLQGPIIVTSVTSPPHLSALDALTGTDLWREDLHTEPVNSAVIIGRRVVVPTVAGVEVRSLLNGELLPESGETSLSGPFYVGDHRIVGATTLGKLVVGDTFSAGPWRYHPGPGPGLTPLVASNAVVFVGDDGRLMHWTLDDGEPPRLWFDTGDWGEVSHSLTMIGDRVFVPVAGTGIVCLEATLR